MTKKPEWPLGGLRVKLGMEKKKQERYRDRLTEEAIKENKP